MLHRRGTNNPAGGRRDPHHGTIAGGAAMGRYHPSSPVELHIADGTFVVGTFSDIKAGKAVLHANRDGDLK
jgi:hypothetical protein